MRRVMGIIVNIVAVLGYVSLVVMYVWYRIYTEGGVK